MPSKKTSQPAASVTAERLREAREAAGLRLDDASTYAREILGSGPSRETIRRYEASITPEDQMDPMVIAALATVYEVRLDWISPFISGKVTTWANAVGLEPAKVPVPAEPRTPGRPRNFRPTTSTRRAGGRRGVRQSDQQSSWTANEPRHGTKEGSKTGTHGVRKAQRAA